MATPTTRDGMRLETTLEGAYYCDPAVLEKEWEAVFYRSWLCAGREERVAEPGQFLTVAVGKESVLVVRDRDGGLGAFYNVCRHRGARLCDAEEGRLKGAVTCPYHAWSYGLDGRLIGTPQMRDGDGFRKEDFPLYPVAVATWGGFVFVNLDGEHARPIAECLEEIPERRRRYPLADLRVGARAVHEVECNWKILVENYQECYHCPGVHPELCDLVPLYRKGVVDAIGADIAYFRDGACTFTGDGTTRRPFLSGLTDDEKRKYDGEMIYPTLMLNLFPDYAQYRLLSPLSASRTRIVTEWLFEPKTMTRPDFDPKDAIDFINLVAKQDWTVCESVQKGVASRAHARGVYVPLEEHAAKFKDWYLERLKP